MYINMYNKQTLQKYSKTFSNLEKGRGGGGLAEF